MGARTRIAIATSSPAERAAIIEWLDSGGFHGMPIANLGMSARELEALQFEMLILDADLMTVGALMQVARYRATPRPVIVVGEADPEVEIDAERRGASYLVRPLERSSLLFAVTLALAEGRPMRRSARKLMPRVPALIDGVPTRVVDVSYEGVRIELAEKHRGVLPPYFTLRVPLFDLGVMVQRVWVNTAMGTSADGHLWCGGALTRNPQRTATSWHVMVDTTPAAPEPQPIE